LELLFGGAHRILDESADRFAIQSTRMRDFIERHSLLAV
jgi:hypothetical protein